MFFANWMLGGPWDSQGIRGSQRFVEDVWNLIVEPLPEAGGVAPAYSLIADYFPPERRARALRRRRARRRVRRARAHRPA